MRNNWNYRWETIETTDEKQLKLQMINRNNWKYRRESDVTTDVKLMKQQMKQQGRNKSNRWDVTS